MRTGEKLVFLSVFFAHRTLYPLPLGPIGDCGTKSSCAYYLSFCADTDLKMSMASCSYKKGEEMEERREGRGKWRWVEERSMNISFPKMSNASWEQWAHTYLNSLLASLLSPRYITQFKEGRAYVTSHSRLQSITAGKAEWQEREAATLLKESRTRKLTVCSLAGFQLDFSALIQWRTVCIEDTY